MPVADPTLRLEKRLLREGAELVIGVDEVGRGAIAGPVAVGVSVIDARPRRLPAGLRDSKLLSEARRTELRPLAAAWSRHWAVGMASNDEVDRIGIIAALGLAGSRAVTAILETGVSLAGARTVLDGSHDWLTPALRGAGLPDLGVATRVKADRDCGVVAAASVLAKVHRDEHMIDADGRIPGYAWTSNKGYASTEHYAAIDRIGASELHRWSWLRQPALLDL
jgi:ribonuclease HII